MQILILGSTDLPARREIFRRAVASSLSLSLSLPPCPLASLPPVRSLLPRLSSFVASSPRFFLPDAPSTTSFAFSTSPYRPRLARGLVTRA
jgi:hypothetical protein